MSDYEYEEANLDDFMLRAASVLSEENSPDYETIVDSLNQHLSGIIKNQADMDSFFDTLNGVIFGTQNDEPPSTKLPPTKIKNKNVFKLYPIIYGFNPKSTSVYIDHFLDSLDRSTCENNRKEFSFLSHVFAEVIKSLFNNEKKSLTDKNKNFLYEKFLNFCNDKIKTNKKTEQSFGCLLLTEFIENCPMVKEEQSIEELFKIISEYLDDRWFECKLDLLNCTISLIFTAEQKFRPYANVCLFRVLDYLTDSEWMKRKLAINIVYTLVCFCKDEILSVKDNIMEFLNILKDDPVEEVKDVCLQTMKYIEDVDPNNANQQNGQPKKNLNDNLKKNKSSNVNKNKNNKSLENKFNSSNNTKNKTKINRSQKNYTTEKKINDMEINTTSDEQKNLSQTQNKQGSIFNSNQFKETIDNILEQLNKIQNDQNYFLQMINNLQQTVESNYNTLDERLKKIEEKSEALDINCINSNYYSEPTPKNNNKKEEYKNENEQNGYTKPEPPYAPQEENIPQNDNKTNLEENISNTKDNKNQKLNVDENAKMEAIKNKFISGKYSEALVESKDNEKYLMKLLPLLDRGIIPRVDMTVLEDIISRLNKKLSLICLGEGRSNINEILSFYINLTKAKINLKLITQLNIKDTLKFLKNKSKNKLIQSDIKKIDTILKSLKV